MSTEEKIKECFKGVSAAAGFDVAALSTMMDERYMGEFSIFLGAADLFFKNYLSQIADVDKAIANGDRKQITSSVHKFKGMIANFHNAKIPEMANEIELNAQTWPTEKIKAQFEYLKIQLQDFLNQLQILMDCFSRIDQVAA